MCYCENKWLSRFSSLKGAWIKLHDQLWNEASKFTIPQIKASGGQLEHFLSDTCNIIPYFQSKPMFSIPQIPNAFVVCYSSFHWMIDADLGMTHEVNVNRLSDNYQALSSVIWKEYSHKHFYEETC